MEVPWSASHGAFVLLSFPVGVVCGHSPKMMWVRFFLDEKIHAASCASGWQGRWSWRQWKVKVDSSPSAHACVSTWCRVFRTRLSTDRRGFPNAYTRP